MFKHGFPPEWSTFKKLIWLVGTGIAGAASGIWKTVTGTLIHITDALASPVKELSVAIEPQQSGSGDPSPDNVRPITGWTGLNLSKAGSNLMSSKTIVGDNYNKSAGNTLSSSSGASASGTNPITVVNTTNWRGVGFFSMPLKKGETYYFRVKTNASSTSNGKETYYLVNSSNKILEKITYGSSLSNTTQTRTIQNVKYDNCFFVYFVESATPQTITLKDMRLVLASNQSYEDRQGETIPISWQTEAGTVYGGTLTVNEDGSVDLQPTYGGIIYTSENINLLSAGNNYLRADTGISNSLNSWQAPSYCSHYKINGSPIGIVGSNDNRRFWINAQDLNNPTVRANVTNDNIQDYKNFFIAQAENGTPLTIIWQLKRNIPEPIHLQSIEQIYTLAGENNIWTDVNGEITLTYQAVSETAFSDNADTGMADYMTLTE